MMSKWKSTAVGRSSAMARVLPLRQDPTRAEQVPARLPPVMERFWSSLGYQLGKKAGLVSLVGLLITLGLGYGITQLEFATGQDSYLNADDQVYIDNVAYQDLFGGQAMLSLVSLDEGTIPRGPLHAGEPRGVGGRRGRAPLERRVRGRRQPGDGARVHQQHGRCPAASRERDADGNVVALGEIDPAGSPAASVAGGILLGASGPRHRGRRGSQRVLGRTLARITAIAPEDRVIGNAEWNNFLIFDNEGNIRKSLLPFFPDEGTPRWSCASPATRTSRPRARRPTFAEEATEALTFEGATVTTTGAAILLRDLNDYLTGGMSCSAPSPWRSWC